MTAVILRAVMMYSVIILTVLPFMAIQPALSAESAEKPPSVLEFTIKDSIHTALINNKPIRIEEEQIKYAKANILYARSNFLPELNTSFVYTHYDAVLTTDSMPGKRKDPRIFAGYVNDNLFSVTVDETIYNGGADIAFLRQAELGLKTEMETLRAARLDVELETKRLFYGVLLAYENKRIAEELVGQAQAHYKEVDQKFQQGTASKFDVLQSKVQVSKLIPQLVQSDNDIDLLKTEFKKFLSIDMNMDIVLKGKLAYILIDIREDEFRQEAYLNRPEMILKSLGIDMNKWGIEFAKAGWLPDVSGNARLDMRSNDIGNMANPRNNNWSAGVKVSLKVFDGFATKAQVDQAKVNYTQSIIKKEDVKDQTTLLVRNVCLNLKEAKAIIDSQLDSVDEAKEALRLSEERYKNGVGINLDVLDAEVSLAQVEQNLASGIYEYIMARAQLDRVRGREFSKEANDGLNR